MALNRPKDQRARKKQSDLHDTIADPRLFLHGFDFSEGTADFHEFELAWLPSHCEKVTIKPPAAKIPIGALLDFDCDRLPAYAAPAVIWITEFNGSTLLAKALHATERYFLLNEPRAFADLGLMWRRLLSGLTGCSRSDWGQLLRQTLAITCSRVPDGRRPLIKEWPLTDLIAPSILDCADGSHGLIYYAGLDDFLLGCLKDPLRRNTARERVARLMIERHAFHPLAGLIPQELSDTEVAALHWLIHRYTYCLNGHKRDQRLRGLNSEVFFADPVTAIQDVSLNFNEALDRHSLEHVVKGPVFLDHSKQEGRPFSEAERIARKAVTWKSYGEEISKGLAFAKGITDIHPLPKAPAPDLL